MSNKSSIAKCIEIRAHIFSPAEGRLGMEKIYEKYSQKTLINLIAAHIHHSLESYELFLTMRNDDNLDDEVFQDGLRGLAEQLKDFEPLLLDLYPDHRDVIDIVMQTLPKK